MRIIGMTFASATDSPSLSGSTRRGAVASLSAGVSAVQPNHYFAPFIEMIAFTILLALLAIPASVRAQTITINSLTATPAPVHPGQTLVLTAKITASQNASNYPVLFSLMPPAASSGTNTMQKLFSDTFTTGAPLIQTDSWTVPAGTSPGSYTLNLGVYNPTYSALLASASTAVTIGSGTAASAAETYPVLTEFPVVSGTAQVGDVLTSTTGTWTGATSFAYQWSGNKVFIAGATAATYIPVSSDTGHTLTSTVVATGSPGAKSSATSAATVPIVAASAGSPSVTVSGSAPFVALHTYYMSPTGSDSNSGLTATTAWATPNHSVNCGDVIVAAAGSYGPFQGAWGKVSNCPSTSGGIDGTGGVYFATVLCGGSYVGACYITTKAPTSGNTETFQVTSSNWAVEGWYVNTSGHGRAFEGYGCTYNGGLIHHIAFINDISADNLQAADGDDCGQDAGSTTVPSPVGVDYLAVIGIIAQNSAQDPICLAAVDFGAGVLDTKAGTHFFINGNFSYANTNTTCRTISDTEDFMADTMDAHDASGQTIFSNNIGFDADRMCINLFEQGYSTPTPTIKVYNNTCFQNNTNTGSDWVDGEINIASTKSPNTYAITTYNNIAYQPLSVSSSGGGVAAYAVGNVVTTYAGGGSGLQNILKANNSSCKSRYCNSTFDAQAYGSSAMLGTETYINPLFTNTSDLLANRTVVPNCSAFTNTTQCMGWNANTSTLTTPSIISDLIPTASGTSGKGYQKPSTTCAANADYPTWLKGIVYLHWNGSALSENGDLVTKPCNM
jgi:hypothetical protein